MQHPAAVTLNFRVRSAEEGTGPGSPPRAPGPRLCWCLHLLKSEKIVQKASDSPENGRKL
jgi:hypothetical protein